MTLRYKVFFITTALLVAPIAFAEDGRTPPPPQQNGPSFQGGIRLFMGFKPNPGNESASTTRSSMMVPPRLISSTTPHKNESEGEGEGFMHMEGHPPMMGSSTEDRLMPLHMMGSTTPGRPPMPHERDDMGSSTLRERIMEHATTTPPQKPPVMNFISHLFGFISGKHDDSTSTPRLPRDGEGRIMASTSVEASSTSSRSQKPPQAVVQFFQDFFGRFFH